MDVLSLLNNVLITDQHTEQTAYDHFSSSFLTPPTT